MGTCSSLSFKNNNNKAIIIIGIDVLFGAGHSIQLVNCLKNLRGTGSAALDVTVFKAVLNCWVHLPKPKTSHILEGFRERKKIVTLSVSPSFFIKSLKNEDRLKFNTQEIMSIKPHCIAVDESSTSN